MVTMIIAPPLNQASDDWQKEFDSIMARSPWLVKKLDRDRRWREHLRYVDCYLPEIKAEAGVVVDIGPGAGELLEIARHYGRYAMGIDVVPGCGGGGMGDDYVMACMLLLDRQRLCCIRCLATTVMITVLASMFSPDGGQCLAVNMRGSIEQVFAHYMIGEPHDKHHNASLMTWDLAKADATLASFARGVFTMLRPGGVWMIHFNGSKNSDDAERLLRYRAAHVGFTIELSEPRILKFRKRKGEEVI